MSRAELKTRAKAQLGNNIFGENWLYAVIVVVIESVLLGAISAIPVVGSIALIIVSGPITFGVANLFLTQARIGQKMEIASMFDGFKDDFGGNVILGFLESLFILLWSLLLVIPGIIKAYSWSMAYYIKADHPEYNWKMCLDESAAMMNGHKMELFVLELSFIGWFIVGSLCLGIGSLWVSAYMEATIAQFYESLTNGVQA